MSDEPIWQQAVELTDREMEALFEMANGPTPDVVERLKREPSRMREKSPGQVYYERSLKRVLKALEKSLDGPGQFIWITTSDVRTNYEPRDALLDRGMVHRFVNFAKDKVKEELNKPE
jgi:hypothetical protein